jgi:hypothetical protein
MGSQPKQQSYLLGAFLPLTGVAVVASLILNPEYLYRLKGDWENAGKECQHLWEGLLQKVSETGNVKLAESTNDSFSI